MPGRVTKLFCKPKQEVKAGEVLLAIESMKMEYLVKANRNGEIDTVHVEVNDQVN